MQPEGHSLTVSVWSHKDHFKRDLCLRYGLHLLEHDKYTLKILKRIPPQQLLRLVEQDTRTQKSSSV